MADPAADPIDVGTRIGGVYEITRPIGRGGSSVVWAARLVRFPEKEVAVKVLHAGADLDARARARLQHEAQILCRINHPNVVQVLDFDFLPGGTPYLVLELLAGETLRDRLRHGRLPLDTVLQIAAQIGAALNRAHESGIVHRDLKPGNVFLTPTSAPSPVRDHVKVLDFGLSTPTGADTFTTLSSLGGTPQYMAPEQLLGDVAAVDSRADIFSFGAVLYEMLTGRAPFAGQTLAQVTTRVVHVAPEPIRQLAPDVPAGVAQAVERALEKEPARRQATVTALVADLGAPPASLGRSWASRATRSRRVRPWVLAASALALVAGGGMLLLAPEAVFRLLAPREALVEPLALPRETTVAVMEFENQRRDDPDSDWYRQALQTALNTELSSLRQIAVVAPEVIRHSAGQAGVDAMTAARKLGVGRFISGSFVVVGNSIRIDARIVETSHGLQEAAEKVEGLQDDFFTLQQALALSILEHFQVKIAQAEQEKPRASSRTSVDRYRMLLEAEGLTAREPAPESRSLGPQSRRFLLPLLLAEAHAGPLPPEIEDGALTALEAYRQASESGDADSLAALHVSFPESQREAVSEYARNAEGLRVELANIEIEPRENLVIVSYTRRDSFTDRETGEPVSLQVRLTRFLVEDEGQWKFATER